MNTAVAKFNTAIIDVLEGYTGDISKPELISYLGATQQFNKLLFTAVPFLYGDNSGLTDNINEYIISKAIEVSKVDIILDYFIANDLTPDLLPSDISMSENQELLVKLNKLYAESFGNPTLGYFADNVNQVIQFYEYQYDGNVTLVDLPSVTLDDVKSVTTFTDLEYNESIYVLTEPEIEMDYEK